MTMPADLLRKMRIANEEIKIWLGKQREQGRGQREGEEGTVRNPTHLTGEGVKVNIIEQFEEKEKKLRLRQDKWG